MNKQKIVHTGDIATYDWLVGFAQWPYCVQTLHPQPNESTELCEDTNILLVINQSPPKQTSSCSQCMTGAMEISRQHNA